jgi:hypothetical protein
MFGSLFDFNRYDDRIFKFVYDSTGVGFYSRKECTLPVTADCAVNAVKKFHEITGNKVRHISEFTEITYPPLGGNDGGVDRNAE